MLTVALESELDAITVGSSSITQRRIAEPAEFCGAAFAPNGRFAYSDCGQIRSLGASLRRSTIRVVGDGGGPTWGAEALAFSETVSDPSDSSVLVASSKLFVSTDGKHARVLVDGGMQATSAVGFAAAGRTLLATVGPDVKLIGLDGQQRDVGVVGRPEALSRDGRAILSVSGDGVHAFVVRDARDRLVAPNADFPSWNA